MKFKLIYLTIISILIILIILITSTAIAATGTVGLRASSTKAKRGEEFSVTLYASSQDGINGIDTKYNYNSEKLELISEELVDSVNWSNLGTAPDLTFICNSSNSIKSADLYTLKFKVKENANTGDILKVETTDILLDTDSPINSEVIISSKKVEIEVEKKLNKIEVTKKPTQTNYIQNYENLNLTGGQLTATFDDNTTQIIDLDNQNVTVTGFNNSILGTNTLTVNYEGKTTTFDVTIKEKQLSNIQVTKSPTTTEYIEGQNFDKTGMRIKAIYNDTSSKEITDYIITDGNNLTVGKTSVTIKYTEGNITKTTTQNINVLEKLKVNIEDYNQISSNAKKYIANIKPKTTLEEFTNKITTNGRIQIFKENVEITDKQSKISTGMKIKISLNNENYEYIIVIKGDTNGDGECNLKDLLQVNKHRLNKIQLQNEYLLAGDVTNDNDVNIKDILQINKYRLGKINNL